MYTLEVFTLIAAVVFAATFAVFGVVLLLAEVRDYARARRAIQRITPLIHSNAIHIQRSE